MRYMCTHTVHPGAITPDQLKQMAMATQNDPEVRGYRSFVNLSQGKAVCVIDAPDKLALAAWFRKMNLPSMPSFPWNTKATATPSALWKHANFPTPEFVADCGANALGQLWYRRPRRCSHGCRAPPARNTIVLGICAWRYRDRRYTPSIAWGQTSGIYLTA